MFSYCRLCAEQKKVSELKKTTFDWAIKEKLMACCMWKQSNDEYQIPQTVCNDCVEQLENCWRFAMRITESEQKLIQIVHFTSNELEIKADTQPNDIFYDVKPEEQPKDELEEDDAEEDEAEEDEAEEDEKESESVSETESEPVKSSKSNQGFSNCKKRSSKLFNILRIVPRNQCNPDGTITDEGMEKLQQYLSVNGTTTWNECKFKCNDCDYTAQGFNEFHQHDQTTHSKFIMKRTFPCAFCDLVCKRLQSLIVHISHRHKPHLGYW